MLRSGIHLGNVYHRRVVPVHHSFDYPVFMTLLDLDRIETLFELSRLWSVERFNLVSFYRNDYLGGDADLKVEVEKRIFGSTGMAFDGKIFLLTQLRYLGFCFNPVSFYFCYQGDADRPRYILADVNNTPWNERYCYVLECSEPESKELEFKLDKAFHVSPFMPMDLKYRWRFQLDDQRIRVDMTLFDADAVCFRAGLNLTRAPTTAATMSRIPLKYPFTTAALVSRIYWQALRLWLKRVPFHEHPKHQIDEVRYEHDC
jgi:DUF1365 family protein